VSIIALKPFRLFSLPLLAVALCAGLAGCAHVDRKLEAGRDPAALREVYVLTNLNDHRGMARRIVAALRERGVTAEAGPRTLLPETAEAVLRYEERWAWDFGEHMTFFRLTLSEPDQVRPYAVATRTRYVARSTDLASVVPEVVAELMAPAAGKN
jgi:hypothetical protein